MPGSVNDADTLTGGPEPDTITGGGGADSLTGGVGLDLYVIASGDSSAASALNGHLETLDTISGWTSADHLLFSGAGPLAFGNFRTTSADTYDQAYAAANDTFTIQAMPAAYARLNAGNATAMMDLRDVAMFDGAALTDGYAGLMSQIGIRTQSANYAATVSTSIAANLERDRASVSGVNLDEEAATLLQFQQAYQAAAQIISVASTVFDSLLAATRR